MESRGKKEGRQGTEEEGKAEEEGTPPRGRRAQNPRGQVCIASRGKVKKLCMEVNAGTSADVSIRALRGSGGLKSP